MRACFLIIIVLNCLLTGCKKSDNALWGCWICQDKFRKCHIIFNSDGTFSGDLMQDGKTVWVYSGIWSLEDNHLAYLYRSSSSDLFPVGTRDEDKLLAIRKNEFKILDSDGVQRTFKRSP